MQANAVQHGGGNVTSSHMTAVLVWEPNCFYVLTAGAAQAQATAPVAFQACHSSEEGLGHSRPFTTL